MLTDNLHKNNTRFLCNISLKNIPKPLDIKANPSYNVFRVKEDTTAHNNRKENKIMTTTTSKFENKVISYNDFMARFIRHIPTTVVDMNKGTKTSMFDDTIKLPDDWDISDESKTLTKKREDAFKVAFDKYLIKQGSYRFKTENGEQVYDKKGQPVKEAIYDAKRFKFTIKQRKAVGE